MRERVTSVNVGLPRDLADGDRTVRTGIVKEPVTGAVMLGPTGLHGDGQADLSVHGGVHMAAYAYSAEDYAWWAGELSHPLAPGTLGENLTVTGLTADRVRVGDRLCIGAAIVQVTSARTPCHKLGIRMGDPHFVTRFRNAERLGFYLRVLRPGPVAAGDAVELVEQDPRGVTVADLARLHTGARNDLAAFRDALRVADVLHPQWRAWIEKRVGELSPQEG